MVKDTEEEEKGKEVRNRFLRCTNSAHEIINYRGPETYRRTPDRELMKTSSVEIEDYTGSVSDV